MRVHVWDPTLRILHVLSHEGSYQFLSWLEWAFSRWIDLNSWVRLVLFYCEKKARVVDGMQNRVVRWHWLFNEIEPKPLILFLPPMQHFQRTRQSIYCRWRQPWPMLRLFRTRNTWRWSWWTIILLASELMALLILQITTFNEHSLISICISDGVWNF